MTTLPTIKAVLFDLDGTLVDSLPEIHHGLVCLAKELHWKEPEVMDTEKMIGKGVRVLLERYMTFAGEVASVDDLLPKLVNYWSQTDGKYITFFPGILEGIESLRAHGIKTAVVTNKVRSLTLEFLKQRGIEHLFDAVVAGDDCPKAKPAPDMLYLAIEKLGVLKSQAVMVGDSRNDAQAARAAGIYPILVETGYNEGVSIADWAREAGYTKVYPSAKKVCDLIVAGKL